MKVAAASLAGSSLQKADQSADSVESARKRATEGANAAQHQGDSPKSVPPEEILDRIKALTDNGAFSVRFEMSEKANQLVTKVVDAESGEVIRQLPPEEMLDLAATLKDLRGNIVDAKS